jgi:hypothetical protein
MALATAMERMLSDAALRAKLREAGRATVVDRGRFTFHAYTARLAQIFGVPVPLPDAADTLTVESSHEFVMDTGVEGP